jgi:hypothetical protein
MPLKKKKKSARNARVLNWSPEGKETKNKKSAGTTKRKGDAKQFIDYTVVGALCCTVMKGN